MLHAPVLEKYWRTEHFGTMDDFYADAEHGELPAYSFIEPRMIYNHNDFHPPFGRRHESDVDGDPRSSTARIPMCAPATTSCTTSTTRSARASRRRDPTPSTRCCSITFDEHGGTLRPRRAAQGDAAATTPASARWASSSTGSGCRVPAIAVSAYTRKGTIVNDEMHHGSVIATLTRLHGLKPLTRRDATANDLFQMINLTKPRHPADWPVTRLAVHPAQPGGEGARTRRTRTPTSR